MTTTAPIDALKDKHRHVWASGDYTQSARYIGPVGPALVARVGIRAGERLLDVATGTGLVAIPAARAGAEVTGLDLTPELLEIGRRRAAEEGVRVTFVEGDAEALPFADADFDRVLSTFGVQFAPRHEAAAAEIARVCAPGGALALCNWTPAGFIGRVLKTVGAALPKPPEGASPPPLWGDRAHVEALLGDGFELDFDTATADFTDASPEDFVDGFATWYGPLRAARAALEPAGRWEELRADLVALSASFNVEQGAMRAPSEYLVVTGRRR